MSIEITGRAPRLGLEAARDARPAAERDHTASCSRAAPTTAATWSSPAGRTTTSGSRPRSPRRWRIRSVRLLPRPCTTRSGPRWRLLGSDGFLELGPQAGRERGRRDLQVLEGDGARARPAHVKAEDTLDERRQLGLALMGEGDVLLAPAPPLHRRARGARVGSAVPVTVWSPSDGMMTAAPTDRANGSPRAPRRGRGGCPAGAGEAPAPGHACWPSRPPRGGVTACCSETEIAWNWSPWMTDTTPRARPDRHGATASRRSRPPPCSGCSRSASSPPAARSSGAMRRRTTRATSLRAATASTPAPPRSPPRTST